MQRRADLVVVLGAAVGRCFRSFLCFLFLVQLAAAAAEVFGAADAAAAAPTVVAGVALVTYWRQLINGGVGGRVQVSRELGSQGTPDTCSDEKSSSRVLGPDKQVFLDAEARAVL